MALREVMNKSPSAGVAIAAGLILIGAVITYINYGRSTPPARGDKAFYSDDDGKTFFEDDAGKPSGFDHGGKPAYLAHVFQCGSGAKFVGYLERNDASAQIGAPPAGVSTKSAGPPTAPPTARAIKQPGGSTWLRFTDPGFSKVLQIHCPDGSTENIQPILPS